MLLARSLGVLNLDSALREEARSAVPMHLRLLRDSEQSFDSSCLLKSAFLPVKLLTQTLYFFPISLCFLIQALSDVESHARGNLHENAMSKISKGRAEANINIDCIGGISWQLVATPAKPTKIRIQHTRRQAMMLETSALVMLPSTLYGRAKFNSPR